MPAPITIRAAGYYAAVRAGAPAGEATLAMTSATKGTFSLSGTRWSVTANPTTKQLRGTSGGSKLVLRIASRTSLVGTVDSDALELTRAVLRPIPAAEAAQSDHGPSAAMRAVLDATPGYAAAVGDSTTFWYAFGPVLYRGRLDGSARVLCIASDPGPTECLPFVRRTLVGDSGQKTQGLLAKLGLTRSYACVNAFAVALHPSAASKGLKILKTNAALAAARHALYDHLLSSSVQAVIAFGAEAHAAYDLWAASNPAVKATPVFKLAHPAAVDRLGNGNDPALEAWARAIPQLRAIVTPDANGDTTLPNYGAYFTELDYARVPRWDLPACAPAYAGDDSWGRAASPAHGNCCARPSPDDRVSLLLSPPPGAGQSLRYVYKNGVLERAKTKAGKSVKVDANGIPV